jgi:predicted  nucleic acid-binding Zn-ribbon protein
VIADPFAQLRLLDLQAADTALAQLAHRRTHLPELAALRASETAAERLRGETEDLRMRLDDVAADQRRLENEVDTVQTRAKRDDQRLASGGLPAKELEGLQHEIVTLGRRQSTLEDELLEIMEQRETIESELDSISAQQAAAAADGAELIASRDAAFAEIDDAATQRRAERDTIAAELPADLLALYDKVCTSSGGVGAAMLRHRRCEGCHLELAGSELGAARAAAPQQVLRCDNCRRILVRTDESGL